MAFSPDGKTILTESDDKRARLWDAATGQSIGQPLLHQGPITLAEFSPDGKTFLSGSGDNTIEAASAATRARPGMRLPFKSGANSARLWDVTTGEPIGPPLLHQGPIVCIAFSPDGKAALTGSVDGTARVWEAATGQPVGAPMLHQDRIGSMAFSPDGKTVLTGARDTARLWDVVTGQRIGDPMHHPAAVSGTPSWPSALTARLS